MTSRRTHVVPTSPEGARPAGKPGPLALVAIGFTYTPPTDDDTLGHPLWTDRSPAGRLLKAMPAGLMLATQYAGLHHATVGKWIQRGQDLLAAADCEPSLDSYAATNPPTESLAYVAFTLTYEAREAAPVVEAVLTIQRAATTSDAATVTTEQIRAADVMLKRHPRAKAFRPDPRLELTGAGGGPIEVSDRDGAKAALAAAAARLADAVDAKVGEQPDPEERTHDGPDVPPVT